MTVGEVIARMGLDDKQYKKGLDRLEGITQKKALTLGSIFKGAFSFALGMGLISGFRSLGGAITDFINTAARTDVLNIAMQSVAKSSGYMLAAVQADKKAVMELGIAEQEATQILNRFMQAQLDTADAAKLARVAQDAAVIAGNNSSQAAEQMTEAIAKQRPELLSAFGMTRNMNEIYKDYAETVGKTTTQLTEAEKKQAMLNYILAEGEKIAGTYEASMGVVGKQISSLPRYWDALKNAIARPLVLPALSIIVDGITNALKNAISWAEANILTLQRWGQSAANVASFIIRAFKYVGRIFVENWATIKVAGAALLAYAVATKAAAGATAIFQIVSSVLKGTIASNVPILSTLSILINTYRLQVALAPVATNIFSAALYRLQAALYAVHTALGPIGWIILGISAAVGVGMHLWNKYTQSLQKAAQTASPTDLVKWLKDLEKNTKKSTDATKSQADALTEAGKAAGNNVQSFDEVHQIQEDMSDSAANMALGIPGLEDIDIPELPDIDIEGMEGVKPTLSGFWKWIKQGVQNISDWLKEKTGLALGELLVLVTGPLGALSLLFTRHWDEIRETATTVWGEIWGLIKTCWDNLCELAANTFGAIWGYITGTWENIKNTTSNIWGAIWGFLKNQWETIKAFGSNIFGILADLITGKIDLRTAIKLIWGEIKDFFSSSWNNIKTLGITIWTALGDFFGTQWGLIKDLASGIWTAIKDFIIGNWEAVKKAASNIWTAVADFIGGIWEEVSNVVIKTATSILEFLGLNWDDIKAAAETAWEWIRKYIVDPIKEAWTWLETTWNEIAGFLERTWEGIEKTARDIWNGIWGGIKSVINSIIDGINTLIKGLNKLHFDAPDWLPFGLGGKSFGISIPLIPKLAAGTNYIPQDMFAYLHEGEAVVPKRYNPAASGFDMEALEQAVYRAFMNALRIMHASAGQDDKELVLKIDNTVLARMQLPAIIREGQRQGFNIVMQGV